VDLAGSRGGCLTGRSGGIEDTEAARVMPLTALKPIKSRFEYCLVVLTR